MSFKTPHSTVRKRKIQRGGHRQITDGSAKRRKVDTELRKQVCRDILVKKWSCCSCSPLYKFKSDKYFLKKYSTALSSYLYIGEKDEKKRASLKTSVVPDVVFSLVKGLAIHMEEPEAIKVQIRLEGEKKAFELYLCSVDVTQRFPFQMRSPFSTAQKSSQSDFCFLPLLLYSGRQSIFSSFKSWLETNFGCYIKPMNFNPIDLRWMVSMWTNMEFKVLKKGKLKGAEFVWKVPIDGIGVNEIKYTLEQQALSDLWKCVQKTSDDEMSVTDVDNFMSLVEKSTCVKFSALKLVKISTSFVQATAKGVIKISATAHTHTVLAHLCCLATEHIFPYAPISI